MRWSVPAGSSERTGFLLTGFIVLMVVSSSAGWLMLQSARDRGSIEGGIIQPAVTAYPSGREAVLSQLDGGGWDVRLLSEYRSEQIWEATRSGENVKVMVTVREEADGWLAVTRSGGTQQPVGEGD